MAIYNQIGKTYNTTRRADTRIVQRLIRELDVDAPATILDIGAGTGNYSYELANIGYRVIALEPSEVMRTQGKQHRNVIWKEGVAESLPLEDKSVDGIICTLASHHFKNLSLCFSEMKRVLKENGRIVIFTLDPRMCATGCWLLDYFKPLLEDAYKIHPPIKVLSQLVEAQITQPVKIKAYPLPYDLVDQFFFSGWRKPELYFNKDFHEGTSPLAKGRKEVVCECLNRLNTDLENGDWHEKYGDILKLTEYECGHFFLIV
ncbi:class I SAM-dependent methyltransferase [Lysinibacillus sp. 2017]|uniref:class I SAM-dependent methyltransferase n=1 Tax=unclassified Lysinibacillus TaxID=2636778 RepID=UPI000D528E7D|nr:MULTISPECIES: class I SAM-dependent methyltransferase [unclassified Lysinibacillus]AWE07768.1 class I SAM-dependent methyltransferase [Lysinibacillus sp. 2017]TGN34587.1 class I SAM-dependent methyltransferase [Lysinibacillus sp. S2017]